MKKKKGVPKLWQEVKVKFDIVTSDDIKIYCTRKFQDFTARYIINIISSFYNFTLAVVRENLRYCYSLGIVVVIFSDVFGIVVIGLQNL